MNTTLYCLTEIDPGHCSSLVDWIKTKCFWEETKFFKFLY